MVTKKLFLILFSGMCLASFAAVPVETFTVLSNPVKSGAALPTTEGATMAWGDYNNDGLLDVLYAGGTGDSAPVVLKFYLNNGDNTFTEDTKQTDATGDVISYFTLPGATFMDINNDGNLDLIITGSDGGAWSCYADVYLNSGAPDYKFIYNPTLSMGLVGVFAEYNDNPKTLLYPVDYDNDGWTDILINGLSGGARVLYLYKNNGGTSFTLQDKIVSGGNFMPMSAGTCSWGDYNRDGLVDLLTNGYTDNPADISQTLIYKNNGDGTFTRSSFKGRGSAGGMTFFMDANSDGYLDVVETGRDFNTVDGAVYGNLYINDTNGNFTLKQGSNLQGGTQMAADYGDLNNDGYNDIVLTGWSIGGDLGALFFYNNTDNTFQTAQLPEMIRARAAFTALVDINNDNSLDLANFGWREGGVDGSTDNPCWINSLAINEKICGTNNPPSVPTNFNVVKNGTKYTLSWDKSTDDHTPKEAIMYNIYARTSSGKIFSYVPVNIWTGKIKVAGMRPYIMTNSITLNLPEGEEYGFGVQAVDQTFTGSAFARQDALGINKASLDNVSVDVIDGKVIVNNNTTNNVSFECINMAGQLIKRDACASLSSISYTLPASGMYIIKVAGKNGVYTKKMVK
ncbi:MAG: FG-GAP-like repeat-containing protein [Candidatus Azobacteroides sp.]|nr:FG-GAP-like repeat-containing protein [Candidatus Azobacteroides sp.]